jgi:hypothetical protein
VSQKNNVVKMVPPDNLSDKDKMQYFRNIKAGEPFTAGDTSGDYSLQLMIGFNNYRAWQKTQNTPLQWAMYGAKYVVSSEARKAAKATKASRGQMRD